MSWVGVQREGGGQSSSLVMEEGFCYDNATSLVGLRVCCGTRQRFKCRCMGWRKKLNGKPGIVPEQAADLDGGYNYSKPYFFVSGGVRAGGGALRELETAALAWVEIFCYDLARFVCVL